MNKWFYGICLIVLGLLSFVMLFVDAGVLLTLMGTAVCTAKKEDFE